MTEEEVEALLRTMTLEPAPFTMRRAPGSAPRFRGRFAMAAALLICAGALAAIFVVPSTGRTGPAKGSQEEDAKRRLDEIVKRLQDDSITARDEAQTELRAFLDSDLKADYLRTKLANLDADARGRVEQTLKNYEARRSGRIAFVQGRDIHVVSWDGRRQEQLTSSGLCGWDLQWSRDGRRCAFTNGNRIFVVDAQGKAVVELTVPSLKAFDLREPHDPSWSPDGKRLAFWSWSTSEEGVRKIWVADVETRELTKLTEGDALETHPQWSPDGERIAFWAGKSKSDEAPLLSMRPDGTDRRRLPTMPMRGEPTALWSPDSRSILMCGSEATCLTSLDGGVDLASLAFACGSPAWSPDGKRLAFVRGNDVWIAGADAVALARVAVTADFQDVHSLTRDAAENRSPAWSLDGRRIAFLSDRDDAGDRRQKGFQPTMELYVMDADGGNQTRLTRGGVVSRPTWIPDPR